MTQEKWNNCPRGSGFEYRVRNDTAEKWLKKDEAEYVNQSLGRVLELTDLTVCDSRWNKNRRRELLRWREQVGILYVVSRQLDSALLLRCLFNFFPKTSLCNT